MFRLAAEIVESGGRVVTTTTTRIFSAQARLAPVHVHSLPDLQTALQTSPHVLFTNEVDPVEGKTHGISLEAISSLQSLISNNQSPITILVEADGSRMRPFKAPADHEPVIPNCTTLVVPVVGIDVVGKPLTEKYVHRPELVARIHPGETVTPEMVAVVLAHPQGGRKGVPAGARVVPLINKVEDEAQLQTAREIAERLMGMEGIEGVAIGAVAKDDPVVQIYYR
jgi:molybdenum cofactor cytidylyltransferase